MIIDICRAYHPDIDFNLCSIFHRSILELQSMWFKCSPKNWKTPVHRRWTDLSEYRVIKFINIWRYKQVGRTNILVKLLGYVTHCYDAFRSGGRSLGPNSDVLTLQLTAMFSVVVVVVVVLFGFFFLLFFPNVGYNLKKRTRQLPMNLWVTRWQAPQQLLYNASSANIAQISLERVSILCCPPPSPPPPSPAP